MHTPVILAAFGPASTRATATYQSIETILRSRLTDTPFFLGFSVRAAQKGSKISVINVPSPTEILATLAAQGVGQAVVQPLQLLPGMEFHLLQHECRQSPMPCHIGKPLLISPQDYRDLSEALAPLIESRPDQAILLIGHGTNHPIWVGYHAVERFLRERHGERLFVGVIEKSPDSSAIPSAILAAGWSRACIIPLLLTTGMHFERDINGPSPHTWRSRLEMLGIEVECLEQGLASLPGVIAMLAGHIRETLAESGDSGLSGQRS